MRKVMDRQILFRCAVALVFVGIAYSFMYLLPREIQRRKTLPLQAVASLQTKLIENSTQTTTLAQFSESGSLASDQLTSLRNQYEQSHKDLDKVLETPPKQLNPTDVSRLKTILENQHPLLQAYDARYKVLSKPIIYNPVTDLGLDIESKHAELQLRASRAADALDALANTPVFPVEIQNESGFLKKIGEFSLATEGQASVRASADCFRSLNTLLNSNKQAEAQTTRQKCFTDYAATRLACIKAVTAVFNSDDSKTVQDLITELVRSLDKEVNTKRVRQ